MITKCFVTLTMVLALLVYGVSFAEDVVVPHVFSPHTTAKSGEVNENFQVMVDELNALKKRMKTSAVNYTIQCNANEMGTADFLSTEILSAKEYYFWMKIVDGALEYHSPTEVYFLTADCSGQAYVTEAIVKPFPQSSEVSAIKKVVPAAADGSLFYTDGTGAMTALPLSELYRPGGLCVSPTVNINISLVPLQPNDEAVTGVKASWSGADPSTCYWNE